MTYLHCLLGGVILQWEQLSRILQSVEDLLLLLQFRCQLLGGGHTKGLADSVAEADGGGHLLAKDKSGTWRNLERWQHTIGELSRRVWILMLRITLVYLVWAEAVLQKGCSYKIKEEAGKDNFQHLNYILFNDIFSYP